MALGLYFLIRVPPKSLRKRGNGPLLLMTTAGMSTNIIGDEWAKKNAGIFSGEEGRSSSTFDHSSPVFGAFTVMGAAGLVVVVRDLHGVAKRKDERTAVGF